MGSSPEPPSTSTAGFTWPREVKLGFSTLGDPGLTLAGATNLCDQQGLDFVEVRALENQLDLPRYFRGRISADDTKRVKVRVLASSLELRDATAAELTGFGDFMELALQLNASYVRVFGGGAWGEVLNEKAFDRIAQNVIGLRHIAKEARWNGEIIVETHGAFANSRSCEALNARLDIPVAILWDSHHTWRLGREDVGVTWSRIGKWVRHIHYKDSIEDNMRQAGFRYISPGLGSFPSHTLLRVLQRTAYYGGISLEWEKLWHSYLPSLPLALSHFRSVFAQATADRIGAASFPGSPNVL